MTNKEVAFAMRMAFYYGYESGETPGNSDMESAWEKSDIKYLYDGLRKDDKATWKGNDEEYIDGN
jgi:hypothetical protein